MLVNRRGMDITIFIMPIRQVTVQKIQTFPSAHIKLLGWGRTGFVLFEIEIVSSKMETLMDRRVVRSLILVCMVNLHLLVSFADILCKRVRSRSGQTECRS